MTKGRKERVNKVMINAEIKHYRKRSMIDEILEEIDSVLLRYFTYVEREHEGDSKEDIVQAINSFLEEIDVQLYREELPVIAGVLADLTGEMSTIKDVIRKFTSAERYTDLNSRDFQFYINRVATKYNLD